MILLRQPLTLAWRYARGRANIDGMSRLVCLLSLLLAALSVGYAETRVPAWILELPEDVQDTFIADTGSATFYHLTRGADGVDVADRSYMSIGEHGIRKERAWDGKTPLGVYFVVDQLDTRRLHEKYGITAFPLDYPNVRDRQLERGGGGIWVHGVLAGGGQRPQFDTDGCIALPNETLRALERHFEPLVTPVIVTREMRWLTAEARDRLRAELRGAVDGWADALARADAHAYLSAYADDFRYRGLSVGEWSSFALQTLSRRGPQDVAIDRLSLFQDPGEEGLYVARFRLETSGVDGDVKTMKRLYYRRDAAGALRIVAEDNG